MSACGVANTILARANEQFCKVITFYPGLWQRTSATEVATTAEIQQICSRISGCR